MGTWVPRLYTRGAYPIFHIKDSEENTSSNIGTSCKIRARVSSVDLKSMTKTVRNQQHLNRRKINNRLLQTNLFGPNILFFFTITMVIL